MFLSLFTPTHDPSYLLDAYHSLKTQAHANWEWVIVPNNQGLAIPARIRDDPQVRIISGAEKLTNIGALKRYACDACRGDAFLEFDHDDMLMPGNSLSAVAEQFSRGAGFVYSDDLLYTPYVKDQLTKTWGTGHDWEHYEISLYGRKLLVPRNFPITAKSLCEIYYAPDHIRAWSRQSYKATGGHDTTMSVGDDHDLMAKTYLKGFKFSHTGGCHYIYRYHPNNTVKHKNAEIQKQVGNNRVKYTAALAQEEARRKNWNVINLTDYWKSGWRFERNLAHGFGADNSCGYFVCHDLLSWCPPDRVSSFMAHVYRVLVPGGYLDIRVPDAKTSAGYLYPSYKSYYSLASFLPYCREQYAVNEYEITSRFQQLAIYQEDLHSQDELQKKYEMQHCRNILTALKGQRQPGAKYI